MSGRSGTTPAAILSSAATAGSRAAQRQTDGEEEVAAFGMTSLRCCSE